MKTGGPECELCVESESTDEVNAYVTYRVLLSRVSQLQRSCQLSSPLVLDLTLGRVYFSSVDGEITRLWKLLNSDFLNKANGGRCKGLLCSIRIRYICSGKS